MRLRLSGPLALLGLALAGCRRAPGPYEITIVGRDFAYTAPDSLPSGAALVHYRSEGAVPHEMILGLLRAGVSPAEFADSLRREGRTAPLLEGGTAVLFGAPGQTSYPVSISVTFKPDRHYALWCLFTDGPGKPHMTLGMFKLLTIQSAERR